MRVIADLHIHSKYSQATGKDLDLANLEKWARVKGVTLLGTGDFTHPKWSEELTTQLTEDGSGILRSKTGFPFLLQTEISLIYTQDGKGRKVHNLVYAPDLEAVDKITAWLMSRGRVDYDGRPIFGISCPEFVEHLKDIDERIEVIPAHIWTPWFSMFGANSGFDSVQECFQDMSKHIFALETGLSSDPPMNARISALDKYTLVSNSDAHSFWPWRLGREANVLELKNLSYAGIMHTLKTREGFKETLEVDPAFGKYHFTGHRDCKISLPAAQANLHNSLCPVCARKLTVGVEQRVEELADRAEGYVKKDAIPFRRLLPLSELLSAQLGTSVSTKKVWNAYYSLVTSGITEMDVLLTESREALAKKTSPEVAEAILLNREGKITVEPGYDGVYGVPHLPSPQKPSQKGLTSFF